MSTRILGSAVLLALWASLALAVDVVPNGSFDSDLSGWTPNVIQAEGTRSWDNTLFGNAPGSIRYSTDAGRRLDYEVEDVSVLTQTIDLNDQVYLSLYWNKSALGSPSQRNNLYIYAIRPSGGNVELWSELTNPQSGQTLDGNVTALNVSNLFDESGAWQIMIYAQLRGGSVNPSSTAANFDDIVLDVVPAGNNAPAVTPGATAVSVSPVNRVGANTTTISTTFTDTDQPGINAFTVNFKILEPDDATEVLLVSNQTHGNGGLTIIDNGGGSYTASYSYDPGPAQTLGLYDLYFDVSDGTDAATDDYANNLNELEINEVLANNAPTVVPGATAVSVSPVNRVGANTTTISTTFSDSDQPGINAFTVNFKILEPDDATEVLLVSNQTHGNGGLTITDNGGGSYTASYSYDPGPAQTLGLYDLYFDVSDGTDAATDDYANNLNELEINEVLANNAPTVVPGATAVSVSPVNRVGANTTTISTTFSDSDQPGINAFTVNFKILEPDDATEVLLVSNQTHGNGGLTIIDNGGGSYTASYSYDPGPAQTLGLYDLHFDVDDGVDSATDGYANNLNELEINEVLANNAPTVVPGATAVSVSPVNRFGAFTTIISTTFTDTDQPGINAFTVNFKILEPDDATEVLLVSNQTHGNGGLTITDNGGGSYTASYTYDPGPAQTLGLYDLYFDVSDGADAATDGYANNLNELEINELIVNNPPVITAGATMASPPSIDRVGAVTTQISVDFSDADSPAISEFFVTISVREPDNSTIITVADNLQHGAGGLSITDNGGGNYTAAIDWDPSDTATLGYYDLQAQLSDGSDIATDVYGNNLNELLLSSGGENNPPIVPSDATFASPAAVERIGANPTTISATYSDLDAPPVASFTVSFKLREPDDATEIVLASGLANGQGGVSIVDGGGGIYTASISWDPADAATLGRYDLYFDVSDGSATATDGYANNADELELYDAISNNPPTLTAGNTTASPSSITRVGTEFTMIKTTFADLDVPGTGGFRITIKVRDTGSTEYTLVNQARHLEQGLRVRNLGGSSYEATYLWDPALGQVTGSYDLQVEILDDDDASAIDGYASNADELTVTATAIAGDGNLLHRSNDASTCLSCHDTLEHMGQNCLVCHTPHGSTNIYLVRETIQTPSSGPQSVIFKTLGLGDPYNDPDPTVGDPTSGAMADDSDGVFTGVCEVCHINTDRHRNSTAQPAPVTGHENATNCTACHPHDEGFPRPSGATESSGGNACSCHAGLASPMTTTSGYHHMLSSIDPNYTVSAKTCLMCHVDHDIFRPDLNTGIGQRARNLRMDTTTPVTQGDASVLSDSDYSPIGSGGICLSCHVNAQTKSYTQPDGTTQTPPINRTNFSAATTTHNYDVLARFDSDGSDFRGNCVKCHSDNSTKQYQSTSRPQFSTHDSPYRRILNPEGVASPSDPMEETFCFKCHSTTSNPEAGANEDFYRAQPMSNQALALETVFGYTYTHPVSSFSGRHKPIENAADLADGATRHAECMDCHDVHSAQQGTHDGSTNLVSNALKGTWGVEPTTWPAAPTPTDNSNVFAAPAGYTKLEPAQREYQICLKCHSSYTTLPSGARNLAEEINPNYPSSHGIVAPITNPSIRGTGPNPYCNSTTMFEPWATAGVTYCSDCHRSSNSTDPAGPHGSNMEHLLVATVVSNDVVGTPLCDVCHRSTVYWDGDASPSKYGKHPATQGAHQFPNGCFSCHMWEYSSTGGLGVQTTNSLAAGTINVHGQNKRWIFNEQDGTAGSGQPADAFINGYLADINYDTQQCWAETCKNHSPQSY